MNPFSGGGGHNRVDLDNIISLLTVMTIGAWSGLIMLIDLSLLFVVHKIISIFPELSQRLLVESVV